MHARGGIDTDATLLSPPPHPLLLLLSPLALVVILRDVVALDEQSVDDGVDGGHPLLHAFLVLGKEDPVLLTASDTQKQRVKHDGQGTRTIPSTSSYSLTNIYKKKRSFSYAGRVSARQQHRQHDAHLCACMYNSWKAFSVACVVRFRPVHNTRKAYGGGGGLKYSKHTATK